MTTHQRDLVLSSAQIGTIMQPGLLLLISLGFLLSYSSFVVVTDHFYNSLQILDYILSPSYFASTLLSTLAALSIINFVPLRGSIGFSYTLFAFSVPLVTLIEIGVHNCTSSLSTELAFGLTVLAFIIVGIGTGPEQASHYGLTGVHSQTLNTVGGTTEAPLLGEAICGIVVAVNRILIKVVANGSKTNLLTFLLISLLYVILCTGCQLLLLRKTSSHQLSNTSVASTNHSIADKTKCTIMKDNTVLKVGKKVWLLSLSVFLTFFVTLMAFPAIISDIQKWDCSITGWPSFMLIVLFSISDIISRILNQISLYWKNKWLLAVAIIRFLMVPLLLYVSPSSAWAHPAVLVRNFLWMASILVLINILSNGCLEYPRNIASDGTFSVLVLLGGLSLGSIVANIWAPSTVFNLPSIPPVCSDDHSRTLQFLRYSIHGNTTY